MAGQLAGSPRTPKQSLWEHSSFGGLGESPLAIPAPILSRNRWARLGRKHRLLSFFLPTINPTAFQSFIQAETCVTEAYAELEPFPTSNSRQTLTCVCEDEQRANRCK